MLFLLQAHEDHAAEATVMQAGAFAFFIKPFDNARFLGAVHRALHQTSPEKSVRPLNRISSGERKAGRWV